MKWTDQFARGFRATRLADGTSGAGQSHFDSTGHGFPPKPGQRGAIFMGQNLTFNVVTDYGADNTGRDDSTAAVQRAVRGLNGHSGASLYFPSGTYLISEPLVIPHADPTLPNRYTSNIAIFGDGSDATTLLFTNADPTLHGIATDVSAFSLSALRMKATQFGSVPQTVINAQSSDDMAAYQSGAALHYTGQGNLRIRDINFSSFLTGVHINNVTASEVWINDCHFNNCIIYGLLVENLAGNAFFSRLEITGTAPTAGSPASVRNSRSVGIRINRGDGYQVSDCLISSCGKAALMLKPTAQTTTLAVPETMFKLVYLYFSNCQFDLPFNSTIPADPSFGTSVIVDGSISEPGNPNETGHITRVNFTNCTATAAANNGFYFNSCSRINLTGCSAFANGQNGVQVDHPISNLSINGGQYFNNSTAKPFHFDGIYFGPDVTDFSVGNVIAGRSPVEKQRFGINAPFPTNNRYMITNCQAIGYPGGGINDKGGPSKVVANNLV